MSATGLSRHYISVPYNHSHNEETMSQAGESDWIKRLSGEGAQNAQNLNLSSNENHFLLSFDIEKFSCVADADKEEEGEQSSRSSVATGEPSFLSDEDEEGGEKVCSSSGSSVATGEPSSLSDKEEEEEQDYESSQSQEKSAIKKFLNNVAILERIVTECLDAKKQKAASVQDEEREFQQILQDAKKEQTTWSPESQAILKAKKLEIEKQADEEKKKLEDETKELIDYLKSLQQPLNSLPIPKRYPPLKPVLLNDTKAPVSEEDVKYPVLLGDAEHILPIYHHQLSKPPTYWCNTEK